MWDVFNRGGVRWFRLGWIECRINKDVEMGGWECINIVEGRWSRSKSRVSMFFVMYGRWCFGNWGVFGYKRVFCSNGV